jgi:hypothetical protein
LSPSPGEPASVSHSALAHVQAKMAMQNSGSRFMKEEGKEAAALFRSQPTRA